MWKTFVSEPFEKRNNAVIETLRVLFEHLMLRRTKDMKDSNGNRIIKLPPKQIKIKYLKFSDHERKEYDDWYVNSKEQVRDLQLAGKIDYIHVFSILLRLRQVCVHHQLPSKSYQGGVKLHSEYDLDEVTLNRLKDTNDGCPVCLEEMEQVSVLKCKHFVCSFCVSDMIDRRVQSGEGSIDCPLCRTPTCSEEIVQVGKSAEKKTISGPVESTKFKELILEIAILRKESPDEKVIVFSQFTAALDILEGLLSRVNIGFSRYDGSMNVKQRDANLKSFKARNPVLLASLRSAGVGLNLVEASRVFMLDPWWNSAVEDQAIDRVHRLGQKRPVYVTRYIIENTVEESMLEIQNRKTLLAGAVTGSSTASLDELLNIFN